MNEVWLEIGDWLGEEWSGIALAIAVAATVVTGWLMTRTGVRQGRFVFAGMINATEEALYTQHMTQQGLAPLKRALRIDQVFAVSYMVLFVLVATRAGTGIPDDAGWRVVANAAGWLGVGAGLADLIENTLFLSVVKRFEHSLRNEGVGEVSWIKANFAMTGGTMKMAFVMAYGIAIAAVATAKHSVLWSALSILVALLLIVFARTNFRSAHRRWKV